MEVANLPWARFASKKMKWTKKEMDGRRIERRTFRMQSEHSTTELRAQVKWKKDICHDTYRK